MVSTRNMSHVTIYKDLNRYCSQTIVEAMGNGEVIAVFCEDRWRLHRDNGRNSVIKSRDGGRTWDPALRVIVWDYTDRSGKKTLAIEQWGDDDYATAVGEIVEEYQFSSILPSE